MKAPYTLPNGLSIKEGHLWNKRMEAFHGVHPLLSAEEGRKHPSKKDVENSRSDRVDATKRAEDAKARALKAEERIKQVDVGEFAAAVVNFVNKFQEEFPQLLDLFNRFKVDWPAYFEGMLALGETVEVSVEDLEREAASGKVDGEEDAAPEEATVDDAATT
ncbi:hypothetical protein LIER_34762 [Lithospermum erythrorhizon]|uniref:Uncharacterized protein n=1 Tax=Lithospermum erythrorhizon TaxID=34254 RepID=A0AAV3S3G6_LITER